MQALSTLFSEFYIRLEEPAKEYFPGDEVHGAIIVQSSKSIKTSAVRLKLKGKVTSKSKDHDFYLFEKEVPVTEYSKVEKYLHFPFSLNLPNDIPSSYMFSGNAIKYTLKASLQAISWLSEAFLPKCSTEIKILENIDVSNYPPPIVRPFQIEVKGKKKKRGFAHINVEISKGAIMRGQTIPIRIHIKHIAPIKNLEGILIGLCKRTKFILKDGKEEITRKIVSSTISPILIDPKTLETIINTKLTVPNEIPPTIKNARFFFVSYSIEVNVDLTIKKTIFESSNKVGKRDYTYLKKKLGKYVGCFYIPLVIGTTTTNNGDYVIIIIMMRSLGTEQSHLYRPLLL
jgi:sporulation-control protein spo0M